MKYWYDTEFIEDGKTIDLVSIGVVAEDGREFYAQNASCRFYRASQWVVDNVFPHLMRFDQRLAYPEWDDTGYGYEHPEPWLNPGELKKALLAFIGDDRPEFWGYYSAYDHVALAQLFGTMVDLPARWPMFTRDIIQEAARLGIRDSDLPEHTGTLHNALDDARWTKQAYEFLMGSARAAIK